MTHLCRYRDQIESLLVDTHSTTILKISLSLSVCSRTSNYYYYCLTTRLWVAVVRMTRLCRYRDQIENLLVDTHSTTILKISLSLSLCVSVQVFSIDYIVMYCVGQVMMTHLCRYRDQIENLLVDTHSTTI
jgi:uncharacterized protein (UPF0276 family)